MDHDLINDYSNYLFKTYAPQPIIVDRGEGCYVTDMNGRTYLDFISGVAVNCLGYAHPTYTARLKAQMDKLVHVSNLLMNEPQIRLAKKLGQAFGGKVFFCNSGAEAIEGAIKLARKNGNPNGRNEIISMKKSFHGRTLAAITATGQEKYQQGLEPLPAGFKYAQFGDLDSIKQQTTDHTAAILIEPIQGEGGINLATTEFWHQLRSFCDEKGLLLILDEIQTGTGRTGTFFAYEHYGIKPDIVCLAKGLGGGIPIGALLARDHVAAYFQPGDHASTFGGNPLACSAALAVLDILDDENVLDNVNRQAETVLRLTRDLKTEFPFVQDIRGKGLMWGIELDAEINGADLVKKAAAEGLLLNCIGGHIIRIAPPLIIKEHELTDGLNILIKLFRELKR